MAHIGLARRDSGRRRFPDRRTDPAYLTRKMKNVSYTAPINDTFGDRDKDGLCRSNAGVELSKARQLSVTDKLTYRVVAASDTLLLSMGELPREWRRKAHSRDTENPILEPSIYLAVDVSMLSLISN
ncbi:hypothetical protein EVAR_101553_1 [Eumeta japonica]|uniref:Uncharacterized protein n=1 Tax=Eumeta variegata TaxID=151549 RepID=A0A4C1SNK4_EUMVA|nr:hypothetical protein EVAR_101553_1 [Eumeta japonica]